MQLKSLEKRLAKDEEHRENFTSTIKKDLNKVYVIETPDTHTWLRSGPIKSGTYPTIQF